MEHVPWLDDREARAWQGLVHMSQRLDGALARQLAETSCLSHADYAVLAALTDRDDGRMRLNELGRDLGWEKSRLSHQVTRMGRRGLVAKEKCDSDRRGAFVAVTDQGRTEIEAAAPGHVAAVRELFVDLCSAEQLDVLADVAETVLEKLEHQNDCG